MKITGFGTISSNSGVSKRTRTGGTSGFADLLSTAEAADVEKAGATSDVAAPSGITSLLALQEISEEDVQRRKTVQHGHNMLDELEKLRRQLLMGEIAPHMLGDIARQLAVQKQNIGDPRLVAIMEDIELRTAVELAKLEMAAARNAYHEG
jgi:ketol-acid reductoisomerase